MNKNEEKKMVEEINGQKSFEIKSLLDKKIVGQKIREAILRKYENLTRFSEETGYSYNRVKAWAGGRQIPVVYDFVILSRVLKIPMGNLLESGVQSKREYLEIKENDNISEEVKMAIFNPPSISLVEIALLLPYIGNDIFCDFVCRTIDNSICCTRIHYRDSAN